MPWKRNKAKSDSGTVGEAEMLLTSIEGIFADLRYSEQATWEDALETSRSILATVREKGRATEKQIQALENIKGGMGKWL